MLSALTSVGAAGTRPMGATQAQNTSAELPLQVCVQNLQSGTAIDYWGAGWARACHAPKERGRLMLRPIDNGTSWSSIAGATPPAHTRMNPTQLLASPGYHVLCM